MATRQRRPRRKFIVVQDGGPGISKGLSIAIYCGALIVFPILATFLSQALHNGSFSYTLDWLRSSTWVFVVNAVIFSGMMVIAVSASGNLNIGTAIFTLVTFLLTYISYFKLRAVDEPLLVWDFLTPRELFSMLPSIINPKSIILVVLCVVFCIGVIAAAPLTRLYRISIINRICAFIAGLLVVLMGCFPSLPGVSNAMNAMGVDQSITSQDLRYESNGFILSFFMGCQDAFIEIPGKYTEARIDAMGTQIKQLTSQDEKKEVPQDAAHLVMVINQNFWDPNVLTNYEHSRNPVPNYTDLVQQGYVKNIVSPVNGTKVCNLEYELLTGLSMEYLPAGSVAYQQYMTPSVPTILDMLEDFGYRTVAITAEASNVWGRDEIYEGMGFDLYLSLEDFPDSASRVGDVVSDEALADMILQILSDAEQPTFVFVVTGENTIPYSGDKYTDNDFITLNIQVEWSDAYNTYLQGLEHADNMLGKLTEGMEELDYPAKMCFMGSRLPTFDGFYGLYYHGGLISGAHSYQWTMEETLLMHTVPVVVWGNGTYIETEELFDEEGNLVSSTEIIHKDTAQFMCQNDTVSAWLLPEIMIDWAELPMYGMYKQIWRRGEVLSIIYEGIIVDDEGRFFSETPTDLEASIESYRILNYDAVFGYRYLKRYLYEIP